MADIAIKDIMDHMPESFLGDKAVGLNALVQLRFTGKEAGDWLITIRDQKCTVEPGATPKPQLTLTMDSKDYIDLSLGKLNAMTAYMQGKIKMSGDISLAMRFTNLFKMP